MTTKGKSIGAGNFKTSCLKILDEVKRKRFALTITKRGVPVAKLMPPDEEPESLFGSMKGSVSIKGDIVSGTNEEWEAEG
jgi:prevent-host-death family protein